MSPPVRPTLPPSRTTTPTDSNRSLVLPPLSFRDRLHARGKVNWQRVLAWLHPHRKASVRIDWWPDQLGSVQHSFRGTGYRVSFGPVPAGGGEYDVCIPISLDAAKDAAMDPVLQARNPFPTPSRDAIERCDDKLIFVKHLRANGLSQYLPTDAVHGQYPYILKRRVDSFSRHAHRVASPADEAHWAELVRSPDYLRQEWIPNRDEYAAHLLRWGGKIHHAVTIGYQMQADTTIRGKDDLARRFIAPNRYIDTFNHILETLEFEGLCCVNYKIRHGQPVILEINPRAGWSVASFLFSFIRHLDWQRARRS